MGLGENTQTGKAINVEVDTCIGGGHILGTDRAEGKLIRSINWKYMTAPA